MPADTPTALAEQGDLNLTELALRHRDNLGGRVRDLVEEDARYFLHQALSTPVMSALRSASRATIVDADGRPLLDMHGNGVHNAGFNNPAVKDAVRRQLDKDMTFCPRRFTSQEAVDLARTLVEAAPQGLSRCLFCPGGSEAVEMALALAKVVTGRFKTVSFWNSFHGAGFAAASVSGEEHFTGGFGPMMPGALKVEFPDYYRNPWGFSNPADVDAECLRQMELVMSREGSIAAVIGEPVSATPCVPSKAYWQGVLALCRKHGALLIFDEIIEGLGRTGRLFACENFVTPDVLVLGKSLGGGLLPFAGIVAREELNAAVHRSVGHYTHEKNSLCCAAALAGLTYIIDNDIPGHAARLGAHCLERLEDMRRRHPLIGNVTGLGLHLGIDLVRDRKTKERAVTEAEAVLYLSLERGVSFKIIDQSVITLRPALVITQEEMDRALDVLDESIGDIERINQY